MAAAAAALRLDMSATKRRRKNVAYTPRLFGNLLRRHFFMRFAIVV